MRVSWFHVPFSVGLPGYFFKLDLISRWKIRYTRVLYCYSFLLSSSFVRLAFVWSVSVIATLDVAFYHCGRATCNQMCMYPVTLYVKWTTYYRLNEWSDNDRWRRWWRRLRISFIAFSRRWSKSVPVQIMIFFYFSLRSRFLSYIFFAVPLRRCESWNVFWFSWRVERNCFFLG